MEDDKTKIYYELRKYDFDGFFNTYILTINKFGIVIKDEDTNINNKLAPYTVFQNNRDSGLLREGELIPGSDLLREKEWRTISIKYISWKLIMHER